MEVFKETMDTISLVIDAVGVAVIVIGIVVAAGRYFVSGRSVAEPYRRLRQDLGQGILIGLEILIAADIIRTVTVPTLDGVIVLGMIVLIRVFLSFSLQVEMEGRWPWQRRQEIG